jgi:hypothetical protein
MPAAVRFSAMDRMAFVGPRLGQRVLLCAFAAWSSLGCSTSDSLKKQVTGLETQITGMRADQDRLQERLAALELASPVPSRQARPVEPESRIERPRLKVIHLSPDQTGPTAEPAEGAAGATPEAGGRRPVIRGSGDRIIKSGDGDSDETTQNDDSAPRSVAQLGKGARGN